MKKRVAKNEKKEREGEKETQGEREERTDLDGVTWKKKRGDQSVTRRASSFEEEGQRRKW